MSVDSPAAILYDETGTPIAIDYEGTRIKLAIQDEQTIGLLEDICKELKILNMHMTKITNLAIK